MSASVKIFRIAAVLVSGTAMLFAQSATQSIQGLVTDSSGAVVGGAKVTLTNEDTGVTHTVLTNNTGLYSFPLLPVGNYDIKVEMQGFKAETVRGIRLETAGQPRQDIVLQVGSVAETVEVSAAAVTLQTENSTTGGVIENKRIIELPLNGRNVTQLAVLVPGVQFGERTGRGDGLAGFPIPGQGFSVSANGQREIHQVVSLDGVDAKDPRIHITNFVPSIEALEEFKIQTNAFTAEYGFGGGAQVTMTMKSGTNELHGTLFEFLRNDKLDAENYFLNFELAPGTTRAKRDALRQNQYGLVVSGPVLIPKLYNGRNKTFWAFNFEHRLVRQQSVQTQWFPPDAFRNGDFSSILNPYVAGGRTIAGRVIYDPLDGTPFAGNIIPRTRLHAGALNVLGKYVPRASFVQADPLDFTARAGIPNPVNAHQYFGRVDHNFSASDRVFGRLAVDRSDRSDNFINPYLPVFVDSKVTNVASQWVHLFSQNMINEFRFGFNISDDLTSNPRTDDTSFDMDALGVCEFRIPTDNNRKLTPREHGIPVFTGLGFTLQERTNGNGYDNMDTIQFGDHLSWIKGRHNLKFGAEVYRVSMERGAANLEEGALDFGANESGLGFASFLLGYPSGTRTPEGLPLTFPRDTRFGAYVHDDWKATQKMTINVGLRFDYHGVPTDADGRWRTLDFPGDGTDIGRGKGYTTPSSAVIPAMSPEFVDSRGQVKLWRQEVKFFMPRVGITYRPTEKWVIRTGAGWFDNLNHTNTFTIFNLNPPKAGSLNYLSVLDSVSGGATRRFRPGSPIITLNDPFLTKTTAQAVIRPVNVLSVPTDYKDGSVWKWSLDIQRELPFATALTVGYVGTKGYNIGNSVGNFNDARPSSNSDVQGRRPFQQFYDPSTPARGIQGIGAIRYIDSYGESFYHGLQVKADKRFAKGVAFGVAYTYSKAHGDGENGGQEGAGFQDPRNRRGSRGLFRFDQTHNLVTHYVWEFGGNHLPGPLKHIIGGWQSNGVLSIRSGFPFTIGQGAGDLNVGSGPVRPDLVGTAELSDPTRKLWYNPQAYQRVTCNVASRPDLCHYGGGGYNQLRGPGQRNLDFSLVKNIKFHERGNIQFRSEFFNAFNTPFFGDPGGISFSSATQLTPNGPRDGEIRGLRNPMRIIQFGLKLSF